VAIVERTASPDAGLGTARPGTRPPGRVRATARTARKTARIHWLFAAIFTAGLALRVLAQVAYRPALLYIDSAKYLVGSAGSEPEGYRVLLKILDPLGGLGLVAAVQHGFGLAAAVALYALLLRRGVPRWGAALTAAPVLLDAYQLQLEQTIMPDVLFETMIAAGLVLLLWRRRPGPRLIAAGALVLGAATTVREIGAVLIAPTMIFALLTVPRLTVPRLAAGRLAAGRLMRRRAGRAALAGGCFALPVVGYMVAAVAVYGHFGLASNGPAPEYGRAAAAANCAALTLPADERVLCPSPALTLSLGGIDGLLHNPRSPGEIVPVPAGLTRERLLTSFSLAVLRQQPLRVADSAVRDSVRLFALTRDGNPEIPSISRWQFQLTYPTYPGQYTISTLTRLARQAGGGRPVTVRPLATVLRDYQLDGGYTPGPLYAFGLAAGLLGALSGLVRRRRRTAADGRLTAADKLSAADKLRTADKELAAACLLVTLAAVVLLGASDAFEFSWRYQLPAVVLLPLAGALGLTALAHRVTAARTASGGTGRRTRPASAGSGLPAPAGR
jgi:hypothetical protein